MIAINDDSGDRLGAVISNFSLPETDTYKLWVSSYSAQETGDYRLSLNETPVVESSSPIAIGSRVNGRLRSGDLRFDTGQFYDAYTFEGTLDQVISIRLKSHDAHLWLLNDKEEVLAANSHSSVAMINFVPPSISAYTILASSSEAFVQCSL